MENEYKVSIWTKKHAPAHYLDLMKKCEDIRFIAEIPDGVESPFDCLVQEEFEAEEGDDKEYLPEFGFLNCFRVQHGIVIIFTD